MITRAQEWKEVKFRFKRKGAGLSEHSEREFYYDSIEESCIFDCQVLPLIVCNAFLVFTWGVCTLFLVGSSHSQTVHTGQ